MGTHYVRCTMCEAGIDLDTGGSCEKCGGEGGIWIRVTTNGCIRIEVLKEPPDGHERGRLRPDGEEGA